MKRRSCFLILSFIVSMCLLAGCSEQKGTDSAMTESELAKLEKSDYPVETDQTLKLWTERGGDPVKNYADPTQFPSVLNYMKELGVKLEWTFANTGQGAQQFNLLIASGDIPDLIGYYFANNGKDNIPGGVGKALRDRWMAPMNDYIDKYAPDYGKFLQENPQGAKNLKTDDGIIFMAPYYARTDDNENDGVSAGYMLRKDWLDALGMGVPETIDEWEAVLSGFKENMGADAPFSLLPINFDRGFTSAYDVHLGWYQENGEVKYGYTHPNYKSFLTRMNAWYNKGLIDKDFATTDQKTVSANLLNGTSGAAMDWIGAMKVTIDAGRELDPSFDLVYAPYPVANKGDTPKFGTKDPNVYFGGWCIGGTSEKKELAMKVINYGFTPKGREYLSYGTEGDTFEIVDGNYTYTDKILNNPEGMSRNAAMRYYIANGNIPFFDGKDGLRARRERVYDCPQQKEAVETLSKNDINQYRLPYVTPTEEEASEFSRLQTDIQKYAEEMMVKFIVGKEPIENFDQYIAEMESRGVRRLTEIMQSAYERYEKR